MTANPRQRVLAALIDLGIMLGWGVVVFLGLAVAAWFGVSVGFGPFGYHLFALGLVVLPLTVAYTVLEAGRYEATPGKLYVGLRVRCEPTLDRVGWLRSLARNLLKLGLPWTLAQSAALAVVSDPDLSAASGLLFAILVPAIYVASLFIGDGRTVYDWLTGTTVITTSMGRRFAADDEAADQDARDADDGNADDLASFDGDTGAFSTARKADAQPTPLS